MTDYLLLNTLLSALMGGILWSLGDTPPRCRFWICLLALGCWLVPWPLIDLSLLVPQTVSGPALIWWEATEAVTQSSGQATAKSRIEPLTLFLLAGALGLMVFLLRLVGQAMHLKKLAYRSSSGESLWAATGVSRVPGVRMRIVPGLRNAFISGYRNPIVWVGQELVSSDFLVGVLRHECTHIQQNDNYYRLLIGAIRHMFWWNPIVTFFGVRANEYIELSCDQRCQQLDQSYQTHLATALLERHTGTATAATLSPFFGKAGFNLKRVKQLDKRFDMTSRHIIIAGTGLILSAFIAISPSLGNSADDQEKTIYELHVTTADELPQGTNRKTVNTEFRGGDEAVEAMIQLARELPVELQRESDKNRQILRVTSPSNALTHQLMSVFENTKLHYLASMGAPDEPSYSDASLQVDVSVQLNEQAPESVTLVSKNGEWSGVSVNDLVVRVKPQLIENEERQQVLVESEISQRQDGALLVLHKPRLLVTLADEAVVRLFNDQGKQLITLRFKVTSV